MTTKQGIKKIYTITVHGRYPCIADVDVILYEVVDRIVPIELSILCDTILYEVICNIDGFEISCGDYIHEIRAKKALNEAMKLAMKGKLIYQECWNCASKVYYPLNECRCGQYIGVGNRWIVKKLMVPNSPKRISVSAPELTMSPTNLRKSPSVREGLNFLN